MGCESRVSSHCLAEGLSQSGSHLSLFRWVPISPRMRPSVLAGTEEHIKLPCYLSRLAHPCYHCLPYPLSSHGQTVGFPTVPLLCSSARQETPISTGKLSPLLQAAQASKAKRSGAPPLVGGGSEHQGKNAGQLSSPRDALSPQLQQVRPGQCLPQALPGCGHPGCQRQGEDL